MNTEAAQPAAHWRLPPVDALVRRLESEGFRIGTSEAIDAARLLRHLARQQPEGPSDLPALARRLGPVLCKSREEQERFPELFGQWAQEGQQAAAIAGGTRRSDDGPGGTGAPPGAEDAAQVPEPAPPDPTVRMGRWLGLAVVVLVLAALAWSRWVQPPGGAAAANDPGTAASSAASPGSGTAPPQPAGSQAGGTTADTPGLPARGDGSPGAAGTAALLQGYYPQVRSQLALRPWAAAAWWALALAVLALWLVPAGAPLLGRTRRSGRRVMLDDTALRHEADRVVPALRGGTGERLERHVAGPSAWRDRLQRRPPVHVPRTVEATLRQLGVLQLRYGTARLRPSYLLLVDTASEADPRGRLFYRWAERLHRAGIEVEIRLFRLENGRALTVRPRESGWRLAGQEGEPLDRLGTPPFGQRLVVVSDGSPLLEDDGRTWRAWALQARLQRWRERVLFTPTEPRSWGEREDLLATGRAALMVLPLDESAFEAWSVMLATGELPLFSLSRPQRYPRLLSQGDEARWLADAPPPEAAELMVELKMYLGANGTYWLAACAVPPLMRWDLCLLIGEHYLRQLGVRDEDLPAFMADSYSRLATLPWLRHDRMPNWLRLLLLDSLPPAVQDEVRRVTRSLLGKLVPATSAASALPLELPPGTLGEGLRPEAELKEDMLYLGFLAGHTPRQLMLRAPESWAGQLDLAPRPGLLRDRLAAWRDRLLFRQGLSLLGAAPALRTVAAVGTLLLAGALVLEVRLDKAAQAPDAWAALHQHREMQVVAVHGAQVADVAFSRDGKVAASASYDGTVRFTDTASGLPAGPVLELPDPVLRVAYSPDGQRLATASGGRTQLWQLDGRPLRPPGAGHSDSRAEMYLSLTGPLFSADGQLLLELNPATGRGEVLDGRTGASIAALAPGGWATERRTAGGDTGSGLTISPAEPDNLKLVDAAFSPDGRRVVTVDSDGHVQQRDSRTGSVIGIVLQAGQAPGGTSPAAPSPSTAPGAPPSTSPATPSPASAKAASFRLLQETPADAPRLMDGVFRPQQPGATGDPQKGGGLMRVDGGAPSPAKSPVQAPLNSATPGKKPPSKAGPSAGPAPGGKVPDSKTHGPAAPPSSFSTEASSVPAPESGPNTDPPTDLITTARYSPDGSRLVTATAKGTTRIWDSATGRLLAPTIRTGGTGTAETSVLSPDGRWLATAQYNEVKLWDATTGEPAGGGVSRAGRSLGLTFKPGLFKVEHLAFSPGGELLAARAMNAPIQFWNVATGERVGAPLGSPQDGGRVFFSADGQLLASADRSGLARLWQAGAAAPVAGRVGNGLAVSAVALSPDGRQAATAGADGTVRRWSLPSAGPSAGAPQEQGTPLAHAGVRWLAYTPDGTRLLTAGSDGELKLWQAATGAPQQSLPCGAGPVRQAAVSRDSSLVACAAQTGPVRLWSLSAAGNTPRVEINPPGTLGSLQFSPDGSRLLTAGSDGTARLWDATTGAAAGRFDDAPRGLSGAAFSPDGSTVATHDGSQLVRLWEAATGRNTGQLRCEGPVQAVAFAPVSGRLLTLGGPGSAVAELWEPASGQRVALLPHQAPPAWAAFSADGARLATSTAQGQLQFWDANTGDPLQAPSAALGPYAAAAQSADGRAVLLAASGTTTGAGTAAAAGAAWFYLPALQAPAPRALNDTDLGGGLWLGVAWAALLALLVHAVRQARRRSQPWRASA